MNFEYTLIDEGTLKTREIIDCKSDYNTKYDCVVLTCYMTSKQDPQRHIIHESNNYEYMKPWYETMCKLGLHGIIFHDNLNDEFINKYQTDKIFFKKAVMGKYSINDERYMLYYKFLLENSYKYILMTDISDVHINKNPFDVITDDKIFVGTNVVGKGPETNTPRWEERRKWKLDPFNKKIVDAGFDASGFHPGTKQIYSAGLLGGNYQKIMWFLIEMLNVMFLIDSVKNYNMIIFNYVIYKYLLEDYDKKTFCTKYVHTGHPFNSLFGRNEKIDESECCLIHK